MFLCFLRPPYVRHRVPVPGATSLSGGDHQASETVRMDVCLDWGSVVPFLPKNLSGLEFR